MVEHALRRWRKGNGLTLVVLAGRVGVTPSHLSEIERGRNRPSLELAAKLSRITKNEVPLSDFVPQQAAE
jgi:transcriptional regulator with XRE-family HTH domain